MNFLASGAITFDDKDHLLLADDRRLWTSGDYGRTWQGRSLPLPMNVHAVDLLATRADGLDIAGWRGPKVQGDLVLLRSRDRGAHWSEVPLPLPEQSPDGGYCCLGLMLRVRAREPCPQALDEFVSEVRQGQHVSSGQMAAVQSVQGCSPGRPRR